MTHVELSDFRQLLARARPHLISQNWNDPSLPEIFGASIVSGLR
jgi:hypothetical protein